MTRPAGTPGGPSRPTILEIAQARARLRDYLQPTPLRPAASFSEAASREVLLKLESLNLTHSFKIRGAFNALLRHVERFPNAAGRPVVVTASAGNHGRAIACAAERLGVTAVVFTPASAPRTKRDAIRRHGADLRDDAATYDLAETRARDHARQHGGVFISPYNHPDVIAGAGTIGLEIAEARPDVATVFVPLGGGGLASGVGIALRAVAPAVRLIGVEAAASTPFTTGLRHGTITPIDPQPTLADGLAGNLEPGSTTFRLVQQVVDRVCTVNEAAIAAAIRAVVADEHLVIEGSAGVAVAAALSENDSGPVVALVTGANIDLSTLAGVLQAGLTGEGR